MVTATAKTSALAGGVVVRKTLRQLNLLNGLPVIVVGAVARDRRQPCAETRCIAESVQPAQRLKKGIVDQVIDFAQRYAGQENAVDHAGIEVVEFAESRTI